MLSDFVKYVKQYWHDRPDKSTPLNAERLNHIENGIGSNSEAINQIANAVVSNIVNDPDKIASMAAVYTLQEKLGTDELPSDAPDVISAINTLNSNLFPYFKISTTVDLNTLTTEGMYTIVSSYTNGPNTNNCLFIVIMSVGTPFQLWMADNLYTLYKRVGIQDGRFTGNWTKLF
mgnify:CR=1 FL=1